MGGPGIRRQSALETVDSVKIVQAVVGSHGQYQRVGTVRVIAEPVALGFQRKRVGRLLTAEKTGDMGVDELLRLGVTGRIAPAALFITCQPLAEAKLTVSFFKVPPQSACWWSTSRVCWLRPRPPASTGSNSAAPGRN